VAQILKEAGVDMKVSRGRGVKGVLEVLGEGMCKAVKQEDKR